MTNVEQLERELNAINRQIEEKRESMMTMEMYMPKVNGRKRQVLGRQLTKLNYTAGNKLVEIRKALAEHK